MILPTVVPNYPDFRFLFYPISLMLGFISTVILFSLSFQAYFLQQAARHKVITCPGTYNYQGEEALVFFVNRGETTVFRDVSLIALKELGSMYDRVRSKLLGMPRFVIFATHPMNQGLLILPAADSIAFRKDDVIEGIKGLNHDFFLRHPNLNEDPQVCIAAFSEQAEPTKLETYSTSLVAGSLLGKLSDLLKFANGELDDFPCSSIGRRMYFQLYADISKAKIGQEIPAKFVKESVTIPPLWSREIYNKLDSIEKKLRGQKQSEKEEQNGKKE